MRKKTLQFCRSGVADYRFPLDRSVVADYGYKSNSSDLCELAATTKPSTRNTE
jgi:hypothetical protein